MQGPCRTFQGKTRIESVYSASRFISGTPLHDSFHLGQTVINDYGRPYAERIQQLHRRQRLCIGWSISDLRARRVSGRAFRHRLLPALAQILSNVDDVHW